MVFLIKFMTSSDILYSLRQLCGIISYAVHPGDNQIFPSRLIPPWEFFHPIVCWWSFTFIGVWETANLLKFPEPFFRYSSQSQQFCGQYGLDHSSNFEFLQFFIKTLGNRSRCSYYNWYYLHPHVLHFFRFMKISIYLTIFSLSFIFTQWSSGTAKSTVRQVRFILVLKTWSSLVTGSGCRRGVMVKAIDCRIVISEFELQSRYYVHFRANTLGKVWTPLSSQLWVK